MIGPITQGDGGPAVEDIQRRLLALGFDLGPGGVDGLFSGATLAAVRRFQHGLGLSEDGIVGDETWAALVDATFRLGDRLLYLKFPYLHGADVRVLQGALNVLGFACGVPDGIFGAFTERAVRDFQVNVGLPEDGIAGPETVRAVERLQHVWQDKDPTSPAALAVVPARAAEALRRVLLVIVWHDSCGEAVAERIANLAHAAEPEARVAFSGPDGEPAVDGRPSLTLHLACDAEHAGRGGVPVIAVHADVPAEGRFIAAFEGRSGDEGVVVVHDVDLKDEHAAQASAVRVLDGVCAVLSRRSQ